MTGSLVLDDALTRLDAPDGGGPGPSAREVRLLVGAGLLRALLPGVYVAADVVQTPRLRARAARELLPAPILARAGVLMGGIALWVHAGGTAPTVLEVALPPGRGVGGTGRVVATELRLDPQDRVDLGGVAVTSLVRTAVDLARSLPPAEALPLLRTAAGATGLDAADALRRAEQLSRSRGLVRARATLRAWAAQASPPLPGPTGPAPGGPPEAPAVSRPGDR
jgi:hypothetical protein